MNFLELARKTRQWSGTMSGTISSVVDQIGQAGLVVDAVAQAWDLIQTKHSSWSWLRSEFSVNLSAVTPPTEARYTAAAFGLTRFSDWVRDRVTSSDNFRSMRLYLTATGVSDESDLQEITWERWKTKYGRGTQTADRPTEWAVAPDLRLCLGKPPSAAYTLRGEYWKGPQTLSANSDTPEMPSRFHMAIVWRAILLLNEKDEADQLVYARAENKYAELMGQLERDQLPPITIGGNPLA